MIAVIIIIAFSVLFLWQNAAKGGEIKIGFIGPLTGGSPVQWGQGSLNMIQMAADEINVQGGIKDKKIIIVPEDGKCQSNDAIAAARKLIDVDGVKFILGGHCSVETSAIAPILEENRIFGLAGVSTADGIVSKYSYAFRTSPPNEEQGRL
ncbi:MAG: ABC transporter substrate-binding protein, partial [Candidatus Aenigmarchaeota archaeon]|nr:ABC transporter substrate-binding protein [Candidatus Aenigmarchaeota archaeon]